VQTNGAAVLDLNVVDRGRPTCSTTDVERTHGQLGTRLTDGLCGDNADSLAHIDLVATGQVTAITLGTDTVTSLTGDRRANPDFVHTGTLKGFNRFLIQQDAGLDNGIVLVRWRKGCSGGNTTKHTITQRYNHVATLDVRRHQQTFFGTTIGFGNDQILGNVNQTASQVT